MRIVLGGINDSDDGPVEREAALLVRVFLVALVAKEVAEEGSRKRVFGAVTIEFATLLATCLHHVIPICNLE